MNPDPLNSGDDQLRILAEIRDILRQQTESQQSMLAAIDDWRRRSDDYRKWAVEAQESSHRVYREHAQRQRNVIRLWFALLAALVVFAGLLISRNLEALLKTAADKAGLPEFVLPEDKPGAEGK
jgi:ribosomal protein L20